MEFKFNVSDIFPGPIVEINQNLIPPGFTGDRRALWDAVSKVSEVVNSMGDASAAAQGLTKPITSADRLRNSEQTIYLLVDRNAKNGKGVVTGMLKTGKKSLYVFDRDGHHYQVSPPCVLDFYVHESRQRTGLGKQLFEHMLQLEKVEPVKMAIDRPSEKLLSFLDKHYGLNSALRQMNNYVVFDGFFPEPQIQSINGDGSNSDSSSKIKSANGLQANYTSPYGRYGAPRPPCSMGQIIHNQSPVQSNEPSGVSLNQKIKDVTQSTPTMQYQQQIKSNEGYANVCQSAPNVPYQQTNPQQQMMQHYMDSNTTLQQPNVCPYSHQHLPNQQQYSNIMQNQQSTPQYEQPEEEEAIVEEQQPNVVYRTSNNGISPREEEPPCDEDDFIKDPYKSEQVIQPQRHVASQPNMQTHQQHHHPPAHHVSQQHFSNAGSGQYHQQMHAKPQPQFIHQPTMAPYQPGMYQQHVTPSSHSYQEMLAPQHVHSHQMAAHQTAASQQHTVSSYQDPEEYSQPNLSPPPQTPSHHHHVQPQQPKSPRPATPCHHHHMLPEQMVASHQAIPSQSSHYHRHPQQMVSRHQAQTQQMMSPHQAVQSPPTTPSHQHVIHPQQMVSYHTQPQQIESPYQTRPSTPLLHPVSPQPQHAVHPHQQHVTHSHHHVHPQQMVSSPHESLPSHQAQHRQTQQPQHLLHSAQPQSTPVVAPVQQLSQLQSTPTMQPAQENVQYQQYIQPPNTEQPVHMKTQYGVAAPQTNIVGQTVKSVPYQYYDSSTATMQTRYLQPHDNPSQTPDNVYAQQMSHAAGDMSTVQKSPDYHQGQKQNTNRVAPSRRVSPPPPPLRARHRAEQETVGSLLQDGSGQRMQLQGQQMNGPQIASQ